MVKKSKLLAKQINYATVAKPHTSMYLIDKVRIYMVARNLVRGEGLLRFSSNADKIVVPNGPIDKNNAMVIAGFGLFGIAWSEIYKSLGIDNNLLKAFRQCESAYKELVMDADKIYF